MRVHQLYCYIFSTCPLESRDKYTDMWPVHAAARGCSTRRPRAVRAASTHAGRSVEMVKPWEWSLATLETIMAGDQMNLRSTT